MLLPFYAIATRYFYKQFRQLTSDGVKQTSIPPHLPASPRSRATWQLSGLDVNVDAMWTAALKLQVVLGLGRGLGAGVSSFYSYRKLQIAVAVVVVVVAALT